MITKRKGKAWPKPYVQTARRVDVDERDCVTVHTYNHKISSVVRRAGETFTAQ